MESVTLDPNLTGQAANRLLNDLGRLIVGQDEAVHQIVKTYQMYLAGMSPLGRPICNFLFLGPTGSGKTRTVEATAECLLGNPKAVIKIDCAEFQHSHEVAKLIGSPPGYLGHRETHPALSQEMLNEHHTEEVKISFVLFDEIEKASDAVWNLLLGILDKASLTLGDNRKVDFSQSMIFLTSNLGAAEMSELTNPRLGFRPRGLVENPSQLDQRMASMGLAAARRKFTPEFINRLDRIVVFKPLGTTELNRILDLELNAVQQRIVDSNPNQAFIFTVTKEGKEFLLDRGSDSRYGARHLKRAVEQLLVYPMSNLIATNQIHSGDWIKIDRPRGSTAMTFHRQLPKMPLGELNERANTRDPLKDMVSVSGAPWSAGAALPVLSKRA